MANRRSTQAIPVCPLCGSVAVTRILYGFPGYEAMEAAQRGEIVLGGCSISDDSPHWACLACHEQFNAPEATDATGASAN